MPARSHEDALVGDTLRAFRQKSIEGVWEQLDFPDAGRFASLWQGLADIGVTLLGLPEELSGLALSPAAQFDVLHELGAALPALGFALVSHVTATASLLASAGGALPADLGKAVLESRFALAASPLDRTPETAFTLTSNGKRTISGAMRVGLAHPDFLVVPALDSGRLRQVTVRASDPGVRFAAGVSSHGLRLVPFGTLTLDHVGVRADHVLDWPADGIAARAADGLVSALLGGIATELLSRAAAYAKDRYQGGRMIHEHDAVQQLLGPIELARRGIRALSLAALADAAGPADGGASAFAATLVRRSGLDGIQTFGGYGYMEDYRVERSLRDANTLETSWIHAAARQRAIARDTVAAL